MSREPVLVTVWDDSRIGMVARNMGRGWRAKTLDQLEGVVWGPPQYDSSLVKTCHRLRTKPVGEFTTEELRIMIGQNISLAFLIPLALEVLEEDALAEGDFFPGDLLCVVLRSDAAYWQEQKALRSRLERVLGGMSEIPSEILDSLKTWRSWKP